MIDFSKYTLQELRAIGAVLDDLMREDAANLESWKFAAYVRSTAREAFRADSAAIDQQARDAAEVPAAKVQLSSIYGTCVAEPAGNVPAADAPPAEEPDELRDLRALVDTLSRCSDRLAALALAEGKRFDECGQMDAFIKVTTLSNANRSIINILYDIRDHFKEVLSDD